MDSAPTARTALRHLGAGARWVARAVLQLGAAGWTHRALVVAVLVRVVWWASLWLAISAASNIFDVRSSLDVPATLERLGLGLALCWGVVVFATAKHLRWAAIVLGTAHGALGWLLWTASGGI